MTRVSPAGPMFFCAPAYTTPKRSMGNGSERIIDEQSATSGTGPTSGISWTASPPMVSLGV